MAEFIVGRTDGYHSIAFSGGLEPVTRLAFSITSPSALQNTGKDSRPDNTALAEVAAGAIANVKA